MNQAARVPKPLAILATLLSKHSPLQGNLICTRPVRRAHVVQTAMSTKEAVEVADGEGT